MAERALATAFVNIVPGTKAMEQYLKGDLSKQASAMGGEAGGKFASGFGSKFKSLVGPLLATAVTAGVASFVSSSVKAANALYIEFEGVNQVFGESAGAVQEFAKQAAKTAGISESAALQAAKGFGGFATAAKLGSAEAAKFSTDLVQASGDLASFYGGSTQTALDSVKSALMGQYEPLRKYNILMDENVVKQEAMRLGLIKTTNEALTPSQKVLAVQSYLMNNLGAANGDFVNYADTFDNAQKTMTANFENMQASIGTSLLPVLGQLVAAINPLIEKAGPLLFSVFQKLIPLFELVTKTIDKIMPALDPIISAFGMLVDVVVEILEIALPPLLEVFNAFLPVLQPLMSLFMTIVKAILPPLATVISKVLVPILTFLIDILVKYLIPYWAKLAEILGGVLAVAVDIVVKAFDWLRKKVEPLWNAIKPLIEGFMSLMGIKPIKLTATVTTKVDDKASGSLGKLGAIDYSKLGAGTGTGGKDAAKTAAANAKKIKAALAKANKAVAKAQATYQKEVAKAYADFAEKRVKIEKQYSDTVNKLTATRDADLAKALDEHNSNVLAIQNDFSNKMADIVKESKDRLRSAFESVAKVDVGATFADLATKNADSLIVSLKEKLTRARELVANAGKLASAGFSQTFIEQVVAQGPDAGNAMAKAILEGSPDAQAEIQALFSDSEKLAGHGMDALADQMYEKSGLANEALRELYAQAQVDLAKALENEAIAYKDRQTEIQKTFDEGMLAAKVTRDEAMAEAEAALQEALAEATAKLNESLKAIEDELNATLKEFKKDIRAHAKEIAAVKSEVDAIRLEAQKPIVITKIINEVVNKAGSTSSNLKLASGGLVTRPTEALIGERGPELVMPLDEFAKLTGQDSNGSTINYYAAPNQSLNAEQALFQAMKRAKVVGAW